MFSCVCVCFSFFFACLSDTRKTKFSNLKNSSSWYQKDKQTRKNTQKKQKFDKFVFYFRNMQETEIGNLQSIAFSNKETEEKKYVIITISLDTEDKNVLDNITVPFTAEKIKLLKRTDRDVHLKCYLD